MTDTALRPTESQRPALPQNSRFEAVEIREILFPSDLSPESDRAFEHAALLARRFGAQLTLFHVVQSAPLAQATDPEDPHFEALRRAELGARAHLERQAEQLPIEWEVLIDRYGGVDRALERLIAARRPDLTVMFTHGRAGIARLLQGSTAETVVQFGRSPVLCVREPDHGAALPYRRLLVPTDLSPASRRAFPIAAELARTFGAEVVALHVAALPKGAAESGTAGISYTIEEQVPSELGVKAFLMPEFLGVGVTPRVEMGSAWGRIIETARAERADLIVMSTHSRDSLADRVVGSHTDRVVRHAPCPVLVV